MHFVIINGPNLNLLGQREKDIYGNQSFESYYEQLKVVFPEHRIDYFQSNVEGELINFIQSVGFSTDGILLNAGGYTHTSVAIGDAVKAITTPVVEVHISNIYVRESFRHTSFISPNAKGSIIGMGLNGYRLAIESFLL
ncbi:MAG: 3-dehydroquinate dehydratase [Bacteroidetes bacterium]|nr:3-dehydroquinate dehydratase [Bacteroidota bacterium]MBK9672402.1 3-dehydroquinate dehydratase [Bacteroidota bacterium]MBK9800022.1 3-dehydroquinate dehydratase [Bacteroidota bacterium]MBP6414206.1 3-dehydroquinate dehydratase [Bacteroidia bacterium]